MKNLTLLATSFSIALAAAHIAAQATGQQQPPPTAPAQGVGEPGRGTPPGEGRGQGRGRGPLGGAAAGFVQNPTFDKEPPELPADLNRNAVLVFSKTNGFREEAAIQASNAALAAILTMRGFSPFVTENGAVMNAAQLAKFKLVIWNNASGDVLDEGQRAAFKQWVEQGGSYLGIHGAGGDPVSQGPGRTSLADWKWYVDTLVGAQFVVHSGIVPGDIHIEDPTNPIMKVVPPIWHRSEEWYAFEKSPRGKPGFRILATVDEKSYNPGRATMGDDHPLVWWHCVEKGHALYSALGHAGWMYAEPDMIRFLSSAIEWLVTQNGQACK